MKKKDTPVKESNNYRNKYKQRNSEMNFGTGFKEIVIKHPYSFIFIGDKILRHFDTL